MLVTAREFHVGIRSRYVCGWNLKVSRWLLDGCGCSVGPEEFSGVGGSPALYFGNLMHWRSGVSEDDGRRDMIRGNKRLEHSRFAGVLQSAMPMREMEAAREYYDLEVGILLCSLADFVERILAMRTLLRFPLQQFRFDEWLLSKGLYVSKIWGKDSLLFSRPVWSAEIFFVPRLAYSMFYIAYQYCQNGRWNQNPRLNQHWSTVLWASKTGCIFPYLHISQVKHRVYQLLSNRFSDMYSQLVEY